MPRVKEIDDAGGNPILEPLFAKERATYGDLLNPTKVMAHCPPVLAAAKILNPAYGTRCSTVAFGRRYAERSFAPDGGELDTLQYQY